MSATIDLAPQRPAADRLSGPEIPWLIALAGFLAMYVPIWWWASGTIWKGEEHGHAPLVLAVIVWLFWRIRESLVASTRDTHDSPDHPGTTTGPRALVRSES